MLFAFGVLCYMFFGLAALLGAVIFLQSGQNIHWRTTGHVSLISSADGQYGVPLNVKYDTKGDLALLTFHSTNFTVTLEQGVDKLVFPIRDKLPSELYPLHDPLNQEPVAVRNHPEIAEHGAMMTYFYLGTEDVLVINLGKKWSLGDFVVVRTLDITYQIN